MPKRRSAAQIASQKKAAQVSAAMRRGKPRGKVAQALNRHGQARDQHAALASTASINAFDKGQFNSGDPGVNAQRSKDHKLLAKNGQSVKAVIQSTGQHPRVGTYSMARKKKGY